MNDQRGVIPTCPRCHQPHLPDSIYAVGRFTDFVPEGWRAANDMNALTRNTRTDAHRDACASRQECQPEATFQKVNHSQHQHKYEGQ